MAGFFSNIGEFFTGKKQNKAEDRLEAERKKLSAVGDKYNKQAGQDRSRAIESEKALSAGADVADQRGDEQYAIGSQMQKGQTDSMGANASEYMEKANAAAQGQASQAAQAGSTASARQALKAARAAGLSKGQAALGAGQAAGDAYTQQYQSGLESGRNQYQSGAQQFGQAGAQAQAQSAAQQQLGQQGRTAAMGGAIQQQGIATGAGLQAQTTASGLAQGQATSAAQGGAAGGGFLGGALDFITSDENCKENIVESKDPLKDLISKVRPVDYNYTEESGEDTSKNRVGVIAQDLEKTSMSDNVIDTPDGKKVDTGQQTLSNTNLIVQLAQKMFEQEEEIKKLRGGE